MADVLHQVGILASPEDVYTALTTATGLQSWWSEHSSIDNSLLSISFYNNAVNFKLRAAELAKNEKVVWAVEGGPPDWANSTITWTLSQNDSGTMVHFAHHGLPSTEGMFASINYNWGWYITSMKFQLERGEGMPHTDAEVLN